MQRIPGIGAVLMLLVTALLGAPPRAGSDEGHEVHRVQVIVQDAEGRPVPSARALVHLEGPHLNARRWPRLRFQELVLPAEEIISLWNAVPRSTLGHDPDRAWPILLAVKDGKATLQVPTSVRRFWIDVCPRAAKGLGGVAEGPYPADTDRVVLTLPQGGAEFSGVLDLPEGTSAQDVVGLRVYAFPTRERLAAVIPWFRWYPHAVSGPVLPGGEFVILGLGRMTYRLEVVDHSGRFARPDPIYGLAPSRWDLPLRIAIHRAVRTSVRLVRRDGIPVSDAPVRVCWHLRNGDVRDLSETPDIVDDPDGWRPYRTDKGGRVTLIGLDVERTYTLWTSADGTRRFEDWRPQEGEQTLILEEGRLHTDTRSKR